MKFQIYSPNFIPEIAPPLVNGRGTEQDEGVKLRLSPVSCSNFATLFFCRDASQKHLDSNI
jgi:hypothetical protein